MLINDLIAILACPVCKGAFETDDEQRVLVCRPCGLRFPVRDGIPVMLVEEAERVS